MVGINREQSLTLAALTRAEPDAEMVWEIDETNIEGVIAIREFETSPNRIATILISKDGSAVALSEEDGSARNITPDRSER